MLDSQVKKIANSGSPCFKRIDRNLFLRVSDELTPFWIFQYKINGKQKRMSIGRYGSSYDEVSLSEARNKIAELRAEISKGIDPLAEKNTLRANPIKTFDQLANDWLTEECQKLKHPKIPDRIYKKEIRKHIGALSLNRVNGLDIRKILNTVRESGRKTTANDTLMYLKQIFSHGIRLGVTNNNPAAAFRNKHAGGTEKSRVRFLSLDEIPKVFNTFVQYEKNFAPENHFALALLLMLGVRKTELTQATWSEFNLENSVWLLPKERAKTGHGLEIPLPTQAIPLLKQLKMLGMGSEFVFPSRRAGKKGHISDDTINHALANLFGRRTGKNNSSTGDVLGEIGVQHFVIHDLRRTCRTLLEQLGVSDKTAEKCLNHKVQGVRGVYNQHQYFAERKVALQQLADLVYPQLHINESILALGK